MVFRRLFFINRTVGLYQLAKPMFRKGLISGLVMKLQDNIIKLIIPSISAVLFPKLL